MAPFQPQKVVICGAGLHGSALAYYLTKLGHTEVTVVERESVACAASGKGGGFLARDWGSGVTEQLHTVSFALHAEIARDLNVSSYRRIKVLSVSPGDAGLRRGDATDKCPWLDGDRVDSVGMMDADGGAQVDPCELCTLLMKAAESQGAKLVKGCVGGIETEAEADGLRAIRAVVVDGTPIPCDGVAFTMGPWTSLAEEWLGIPIPITGIKSTSIVFRSSKDVEPYALFCDEDDRFGTHLEVYPRSSGEIYLCGVGGSEHVSPERLRAGEYPPHDVHADLGRVKAAAESFSTISKKLGKTEPDEAQACMRPCPPDAIPLMGKVSGVKGAYISAGHNCWGILWAPVSGKAMSELIFHGSAECVDLGAFSPARFMPEVKGGRGRKKRNMSVGEQW